MIDKEDLLNNKDFDKSFKNGRFNIVLQRTAKKAVEHMLDADLDSHLDNIKTRKNSR
ncbi:hypothetical protein [Chryseobacterium sp. CFS15]|uniref:hypothetical protein n=1 Tax=Chryseobacterium sp. CFS15 TaxID=2986946 RepID=UPI00280852AC|nr:hypothetical protein [Chryseobacterium sp. CFS15]MDQ8143411.1 hypothetical protein [Chryseobacterium sp. CFS15]